jgi:succinate dehydrogenase / fumarate reductase membrane anchor subunit
MREAKLWFWHIITAVFILFLLGSHMGIMHMGAILSALGLGSDTPTSSDQVFGRSQQMLFMVTYIVLLGTALFHGLYGLRSILCELSLSKTLEKLIGSLFTVAGIALFLYGSYVAVQLFKMKGV